MPHTIIISLDSTRELTSDVRQALTDAAADGIRKELGPEGHLYLAVTTPKIDKFCVFTEVSSLVPEEWTEWFWSCVSEDAPFSWGSNNRSMVTASDFACHCKDVLLNASADQRVPQEEIDTFLEKLRELGDSYIDLEN